jgi:hypothetical protein
VKRLRRLLAGVERFFVVGPFRQFHGVAVTSSIA